MSLPSDIPQKISYPQLPRPLLEYIQEHGNNRTAPLRHRRELLEIYDAQLLYRVSYQNESNECPDYIVTIGQRKTEAFLEVIENSARKDLFAEGIRFENIVISKRWFWILRIKLRFVGIWNLRSRMSNLLGYPYLHFYELITDNKYSFFISDGFMERYRIAKTNVLFYNFLKCIQAKYPQNVLGRVISNIDMPMTEIVDKIKRKEMFVMYLVAYMVTAVLAVLMYFMP